MLRRSFLQTLAAVPAGGILIPYVLHAQQGITVTPLADKLHMIGGDGGNIAVLEGADGLLLIDSGLPNAVDGLVAETGKIGKGKVTRVINTHWHYDHIGANTRFGTDGAKILSHENCRTRLATKQEMKAMGRTFDPLPAAGIPSETFRDKGQLKHGSETLAYRYLPPAHTDGDTVIHFQNANVFHCGDLVFNGMYPFIDYGSGGSLAGMAKDARMILELVDEKTKIIPGHGPLAQKKEIVEYAEMLDGAHEILSKLIKEGKTLEQVQAAKPLARYDVKWGNGFMKPDPWIAINYNGMTNRS